MRPLIPAGDRFAVILALSFLGVEFFLRLRQLPRKLNTSSSQLRS